MQLHTLTDFTIGDYDPWDFTKLTALDFFKKKKI